MVATINQRIAARIDGDFVVFLIGARVNKPWKLHKFIPVARAMGRMIDELEDNPDLGMLHVESWAGRRSIMVQYWRSLDHLRNYARMKDAEHLPAWRDFNKHIVQHRMIGIWHETYVIKPGTYEAIYRDMPPFGLRLALGALELSDNDASMSAMERMQPTAAGSEPDPKTRP